MSQESDNSHLFVVRVWAEHPVDEHPEDGPSEYRGRVQHVLSGETRHFRDWRTLVEFLTGQIKEWGEANEEGREDG